MSPHVEIADATKVQRNLCRGLQELVNGAKDFMKGNELHERGGVHEAPKQAVA